MNRFFFLLLIPLTSFARSHDQHPAQASLIADSSTVVPGTTFQIGLKFVLEPHWHVYWKNPGDSGTAPVVNWKLPNGVTVSKPQWPLPSRIPVPPLENYGYEKNILIPFDVELDKNFKYGILQIVGEAKWLVCREECIPGKASLSLTLAVGRQARPSEVSAEFAETRARLPRAQAPGSLTAESRGNKIFLRLSGWRGTPHLHFFPAETGVLEHPAIQTLRTENNATSKALLLELTVDPVRSDPVSRLTGVLVSSKESGLIPEGFEPEGFEIDLPVEKASGMLQTITEEAKMETGSTSLGLMVLFAFLGGLILNLMPCVFPVLSIKILSFVHLSQQSKAKVRAHGWAYTAGVMLSFWLLAAVILAVRAGGQKLGWGFQLQSPIFVIAMVVVIFLLSLSLLGLFDVGTRLMSLGSGVNQEGYRGSLFTGVLATIVATPCTAPLMGPALGFALSQPAIPAIAIFTALGLGMAFPYLVLSYSPALLKLLPKPGRWMETLKQFMAFPLFATVLWLGWVFGQQTGTGGMLRLLMALVALAFVVWVMHRTSFASGQSQRGALAWVAAALGLVGFGYLCLTALQQTRGTNVESSTSTHQIVWEKFSPERVKELQSQGKPMFIDFTAAWCVSCQVNESVAIEIEPVQKLFREKGITAMKADWTDGDPIITETLEKFGRSGVPMYLVYGSIPNAAPQILPEALTPGIVLEALGKIR